MSEIDDIRKQYETGRLDSIKEDLGFFICAHKTRIQQYRAEQEAKGLVLPEDAAIKFYLLRYRSINPKREIQDESRVRPSISASSIAPMLDECARICATE